jgi:mannosyltransferase
MVASLWLRPLGSSFWLDEFGTWWVVKDGIRETISRSADIQGQSPVYYLLAWATRHLVGRSELGMRVPSILFAALTALVLYWLAKRILDDELARLTVLVFVVWPAVEFSAADARPYALATLAVVASTAVFVRWLDTGSAKVGISYVALAACAVYVHYLFGLVLVAHACYGLFREHERSTVLRIRALVLAGLGIVVLVAPLAYQVVALWGRRQEWTAASSASVQWIATALVPAAVVGAAVIGGVAAVLRGGVTVKLPRVRRSDLVLLVSWLFIPLAILVGASILTPVRLLQIRYTLVAAPAAAILVALALRSIDPPKARLIIVLVLALLSVLQLARPHHSNDWRTAMALAGSISDNGTVVLVQPGFTESDQLNWLTDPERRSFLLAPVSYYPIPGRVVLLPANIDLSTQQFVRQQIRAALPGADRVVLVTPGSPVTAPWLDEFLGEGWTHRDLPTGDLPVVTEFSRTA